MLREIKVLLLNIRLFQRGPLHLITLAMVVRERKRERKRARKRARRRVKRIKAAKVTKRERVKRKERARAKVRGRNTKAKGKHALPQ